jgi:hypothetical protein
LAQEIEFRLEQSFRQDEEELEAWGGRAEKSAWRTCAGAANTLAARSGRDWLVDPETFQQVQHATTVILDTVGPEGPNIKGAHDVKAIQASVLEYVKFIKVRHGMDLLDSDIWEGLKRFELSEDVNRINKTT